MAQVHIRRHVLELLAPALQLTSHQRLRRSGQELRQRRQPLGPRQRRGAPGQGDLLALGALVAPGPGLDGEIRFIGRQVPKLQDGDPAAQRLLQEGIKINALR